MKKVGLCIVYKNCNYGSILQSYATILKLQSLGCEYEVLRYSPTKDLRFYVKMLPRLGNRDMLYSKVRALKRKLGRKAHPEFAKNDNKRIRKFRLFVDEHFGDFSKELHSFEALRQYAEQFEHILVGSDQLWLPSGLATNFYNLMFAPDQANKIAYATSFGVSAIPAYQVKRTRQYLERINHIGVREQDGSRIVKELTGRDVPVILDPTMVLTRSQWDDKLPATKVVEGDYIFCYFLGNNPGQRKEVTRLAQATGLKIVALRHLDEYIPDDEHFGDEAPYDVGPAEFVNLIRYARYVCTDSFHGSVFSILYHKQFITFNRYGDDANSRNSRLDTLFHHIGVSRRFKGDLLAEINEPIDYDAVDEKLSRLREQSQAFLMEALGMDGNEVQAEETKETGEETGHVICPPEACTGCSGCSAACPQNAITMSLDAKGFWRPQINASLCVRCNICNRACPINEPPEIYGPTKVFAFQHKNDEVRLQSTSGGFFRALASKVIEEGGVVCGAAYDENMVLSHVLVEREEALTGLQRSKYVQSSLSGVFRQIRERLESGKTVLFVGLPCQAAGLRKYIGALGQNLIIVDLICYGVPSTGLFSDWIKYLSAKYGRVTDVTFRDKTYGYATPNVKVRFENGRSIESCRDSNLYSDMYFRHLSIRESCYHCRFKTVDRASDLTIGDLWLMNDYAPALDDNKGTTGVFPHTEKGEKIVRQFCGLELELNRVIHADARKLTENTLPADGLNAFWKTYEREGFDGLMAAYHRPTVKTQFKYRIKQVMNLTGISRIWYKKDKIRRIQSDT